MGVRSLWSQLCPLPGTQGLHLGVHLHLAVNCLAAVFNYWVSVSLFHLPRIFPSSSLSCLPLMYAPGFATNTCLGQRKWEERKFSVLV